MRQRRLDLLGRGGAHDDGPARFVRLPQTILVGGIVEDERFVEVELPLDRDLRHAAARRSEPALPHSASDCPGSIT